MKMVKKYDDDQSYELVDDLVYDLVGKSTYVHSGDDVHLPIRRPRWRFRVVGARSYRRRIA